MAAAVARNAQVWFVRADTAHLVVVVVLLALVQVVQHIVVRSNMAILRGFPPSNTISPGPRFPTVEQGVKYYGETVAKYLTEEELTRWPDTNLKVQTKIVKQNYWL